jgi:hypothetical protein
VYERIHLNKVQYKRDAEFYNNRDLALCATLYLSSGRIGEVLKLKRSQFKLDEEDKRFLLIHNFAVSKRKRVFKDASIKLLYKQELSKIKDTEKRKQYKEEMYAKYPWTVQTPTITIPCPLVGPLSKFTELLVKHLEQCKTERVFPISKSRAWRIVNTVTGDSEFNIQGVWCHWFRAESLSYHLNLLRSTILVSEAKGVVNSETLRHYFTGSYRQFANELAGGVSVEPTLSTLPQPSEPQKPIEMPITIEIPSPLPEPEIIVKPIENSIPKVDAKVELNKKIKKLEVRIRNIERCDDALNNSAEFDFSKFEGGWDGFKARYEPQIANLDALEKELFKLKEEVSKIE